MHFALFYAFLCFTLIHVDLGFFFSFEKNIVNSWREIEFWLSKKNGKVTQMRSFCGSRTLLSKTWILLINVYRYHFSTSDQICLEKFGFS